MSNRYDFDSMDTATLIDVAARMDADLKDMQKALDAAKDLIRARATDTVVAGNIFKAVFSQASVRWTLDTDTIKKKMGDAWVTAHSKISTPKPSLTFKPNANYSDH
jgi:hypothetical protein